MLERIRERRPSHGTVVAYLALFAALATGGAYAADKIGSGDIAKKAVKSKHVAKNAIKSKHVKNNDLKIADLADEAKGARAYVVVDVTFGPDPVLAADAPQRGFESVERVDDGIYCVVPSSGVDSQEDPAAVSADWYHSQEDALLALVTATNDQCAGGEYEVRTFDPSGTAVNTTGFSVIVP